MVYPYNNDLGNKPPEPKVKYGSPYSDFTSVFEAEMAKVHKSFKDSIMQKWIIESEPKQSNIKSVDELIKDTYLKPQFFPKPIKTIQPDIPVYSEQADALHLELKVGGFGIGEHKIGAQWMISDHHTHKHGGLPVDQAEHLIDVLLADIKKNLMNQIKEKAK